jgi:NAD(P)H-hydrate epimerase
MPAGLEEQAEAGNGALNAITIKDAAALLPARKPDGHKGTFGRVGILGGSKGMAGAVCLCAISCMRAGAGLVYLIVPEDIAEMCLMKVPEALAFPTYDDLPVHPDVFIAGPGGSKDKETEEQIFKALLSESLLVLDAQALNIIASDPSRAKELLASRLRDGLPLPIITPHPGEMDRLLPETAGLPRMQKAQAAAREYSCVTVLKGAGTVVASPDGRLWINTTGNSSMAKGGSGDVLAGLIGAMLAQGLAPKDAAVFGVYFHGLCGDLSCGDNGEYSAVPSDIVDKYPDGFRMIIEYNAQNCGPLSGSPDSLDCCGTASEKDLERNDG